MSETGFTSLILAAAGGHLEVVKTLVEKVTKAMKLAVFCKQNDLQFASSLSVHATRSSSCDFGIAFLGGFVGVLLFACVPKVFTFLLVFAAVCVRCYQSKGAEINAEHPEGVNALMYGAAGAHLGVVQVRGWSK